MKRLRDTSPAKAQSGYILVLVVALLTILMIASMKFMDQSVTTSKMAGYNRDAAESLMLAENAVNWLYGRYAGGADIDNDGKPDNEVALDLDSPSLTLVPYIFFVSNNNQIEKTIPTILQSVADGEARAESGTVNDHQVHPDSAFLRVDELFGNSAAPVLLTQNTNTITAHADKTWSDLSSQTYRAAVWFELVKDPENDNRIIAVAQAMGQVGNSRSYLQRYIGDFGNTLGHIKAAAITEANPNPPGL